VAPQGFGRAPPPDANPLKRQESDTGSTTPASTDYSSIASSDVDTSFEHLAVDWLLSPRPSPDAWYDFLNNHNWQDQTVGPIHSWDPMMRQMFSTILSSEEPRVLLWGNDMLNLYNKHARFVYGDTFPGSLGIPLEQVWGEAVCANLANLIRSGIKKGKPICQKNHELILARYGFPESLFFDLTFLPIPSPDGRYLGVITEFTEITEKVFQRNRQEISKSLLESFSKVSELRQLWQAFVETVNHNSRDLAYAVVYTTTEIQWANTFELEASYNVDCPERHPPSGIVTAMESANGEVFVLQRSKNTLPPSLAVPMPDVGSVDTAYVLPIVGLDGVHVRAIVVLGLDPRRALKPSTRQFAESIRDMLFKSAALFSLPMEQRESKEISRALSQQLETMTMKAEESEQNFSRMLRDAPIGMCMHREDGHCVYVNDVWLELLGMSKVEFYKAAEVGLAWRGAVHEEDFEAVNQIWISAIEKGTAASAEFRVKAACSEHEVRWLEISAQQRHNKEGNLE
jgi:PAS domain S-box-containing protein